MASISWIWESWLGHGPPAWIYPILAMAAVICGLLVGDERQRHEKPAGLRTLSLVCLGSATFTMVSLAFTTTTGDSGRVAAQIVTGIGFLGAGVILHNRRMVTGVTTAAVIWMSAAIGMTVGAGYAVAGFGLSLLVNRLMVIMFLYETEWHPDLHNVRIVVEFSPNNGLTRTRIERILTDYQLTGAQVEWSDPSDDKGRVTVKMKMARAHLFELLGEVADVPDVTGINREQFEKSKPASTS